MRLLDRDERCQRWLSRPLCRHYSAVVFSTVSTPQEFAEPDVHRTFLWALGTVGASDREVLGAWNVDQTSPASRRVFGDLYGRGVVTMKFCIANTLGEEARAVKEFRLASVIPSIEASLAGAASQTWPRHRAGVLASLRTAAESDDFQSARSELAIFQDSDLGKRYPEIVRQWGDALSRFEPIYALDGPQRELVRSTDRAAAAIGARLNVAIQRHGRFTDSAEAFEFVAARLAKAEQELDYDRDMLSADRLAAGSSVNVRRTSAAAGVPTLV